MQEQTGTSKAGRRPGRWWVLAILLIGAVALSFAIWDFATETGGKAQIEISGVNDAQRIFGGLRQDGDRLGDPKAPIQIQIFTDVQCESCATRFFDTVPGMVEQLVRTGRAQLLFRNVSAGPNPVQEGAVAAEAAGEQGYQWQYVYLFLASQDEIKRIGRVSPEFLESVAGSIGELQVPDWQKAFDDGGGPDGPITQSIKDQESVADGLGIATEYAVVVAGPGGTEVLQDSPTLDQILSATDKVG